MDRAKKDKDEDAKAKCPLRAFKRSDDACPLGFKKSNESSLAESTPCPLGFKKISEAPPQPTQESKI